MKIGTRLICSFLFVALLCAVIGGISMLAMGRMTRSIDDIGNVRMEALRDLQSMSQALAAVKSAELTLLDVGLERYRVRREFANIERALEELDVARSGFEKLSITAEERLLSEEITTNFKSWRQGVQTFMELRTRYDQARREDSAPEIERIGMEANHQALEVNSRTFKSLLAGLENLIELNHTTAKGVVRTRMAEALRLKRLIGWLVLVVILIAGGFGVVISRRISCSLRRAVGWADVLARGDLTLCEGDVSADGNDEIAMLAGAMLSMAKFQRQAMNGVVAEGRAVAGSSEDVAALIEETNASIQEIDSSIRQVASHSEANASDLQEVDAGVEEVASKAQYIAKVATDGADAADNTRKGAEDAGRLMDGVAAEVQSVGAGYDELMEKVGTLVGSVKEISGFVDVISGIADQTNLLALNAAIEAARAGDAGRGFAVVAEEVRKLAENSAEAAQKVSTLITDLQARADASMAVTTDSGAIMSRSVERLSTVQDRMHEILKSIVLADDAIRNIANLSEEQAASSEEMAKALDQAAMRTEQMSERIACIEESLKETAHASEGISSEAVSLSSVAERMESHLLRFRLEKKDAVSRHLSLQAGHGEG